VLVLFLGPAAIANVIALVSFLLKQKEIFTIFQTGLGFRNLLLLFLREIKEIFRITVPKSTARKQCSPSRISTLYGRYWFNRL
jgi:hypothetical protein